MWFSSVGVAGSGTLPEPARRPQSQSPSRFRESFQPHILPAARHLPQRKTLFPPAFDILQCARREIGGPVTCT
jgi:hypothetical protein